MNLGSKSRRRWPFWFRIPARNGTGDRLSHGEKREKNIHALSMALFKISVLMAVTGRTQRYTHDAKTHNPIAKNAHSPIWLCEATEKCFWIRRWHAKFVSLRSESHTRPYTTVFMQLAATLCDCIVVCICSSPINSHRKCNGNSSDDDHRRWDGRKYEMRFIHMHIFSR